MSGQHYDVKQITSSRETLRFSGNKIHWSPRDQSSSVKYARVAKKNLKDNKYNSLHLGRKYVQILVLGRSLFLKAHSFPKTVRFSEQIMSADKYPSIFSRQMEAMIQDPHGSRKTFQVTCHEE